MPQPRVLITGGGGFLGRALVQRCLARGWQVCATGRNPQPDLVAQGVTFIPGDVAELTHARKMVAGCDAVFHVAAKAGIWGKRADFERSNIGGTRAVVAACQLEGVTDLVYTSTPSVVFTGQPFRGADESLPYGSNWLGDYARTKAQAEALALAAHTTNLRVTALRPHLIWGQGDPHLFPRLLARARSGKLRIVGDGTNRVDVTHVSTAAAAHLGALDALRAGRAGGRAYFISQGEPVNLWDFVNRLLVGAGIQPVTRHVPLAVAYAAGATLEAAWATLRLQGEPPMTRFVATELAKDHWFNVRAAQRDLGLKPEVNTWEALDALAATFRNA